jgi:hypothetical protein
MPLKGKLTQPLEISGKQWPAGTILINVEWEEKHWSGTLPDGTGAELPSQAFMVTYPADPGAILSLRGAKKAGSLAARNSKRVCRSE